MTNFDPNKFASATGEDGDFPTAPDPSEYTVVLEDASAYTNKKGNDVLRFDFKVITGKLGNAWAGHQWAEFRHFKTEGAYNAAKAMCSRLGMDTEGITSLTDFDTRLKALVGRWYEIDVQQNGEYRNVYVTGDGTPTTPPPEAASDVSADTSGFEPATSAVTVPGSDVPF